MGKRDRPRRQARRPPYRDSKPVILVVTEGEVTEPEYLRGFARASKNPRVEIEVITGAGVPFTIVTRAKELKIAAEKRARREHDENLRYDEVGCVFDIDEHPRISEATQMAEDNGMKLAISNPCIELWLWLHFADSPGMQDRHALQHMMRRHIPNYDKHVVFSDYADLHDDAARRARRLDDDATKDNEPNRNPTTGLWRLTESIRGGSK